MTSLASPRTSPLVSIILPVKNAVGTISAAIESISVQTYACFELIIIDGQSTDGTLRVVEQYRESISRIVSERDLGIYDAMNKGISLATGEWLLFLGADDRLAVPDVLEKVFLRDQMDIGHEIDLVYGFGVRNGQRSNNFFNWRMLKGNSLNHQCVFYRRRVFERTHYDVAYRVGADYKLNLTLYVNGAKALYRDAPIGEFGENGLSSREVGLSWQEMDKARREVLGPICGSAINALRVARKFIIDSRVWR